MENSQKIGIICLIIITSLYVYFSFFNKDGFKMPEYSIPSVSEDKQEFIPSQIEEITEDEQLEDIHKVKQKTVQIYVTDPKGNLRSLSRKCDTSIQKSCFVYAIQELISAPTNWEKNKKGLSSEIPSNTKILSIRESSNNILIDLSPAFESGGGAESTEIRIRQLIKTVQANTKLPVYLYINGKQANVIGGEGIMVKQPLTENSLND